MTKCKRPTRKPLISILVPFRTHKGSDRERLWHWLREYWQHELPEAEIIIGHDHSSWKNEPFSKTVALNDAFRKSKGDIIVVMDADGYLSAKVIRECANRIREAVARGERMWYVPYSHFFRLNWLATEKVLESDPAHPHRFSCPPERLDIDFQDHDPFQPVHQYGKRYGALTVILPREAIHVVNGWDERFRGWGGEDVCFQRAVDALYAKHHALPGCVYHLYHPTIGRTYDDRMWTGQHNPKANNELSLVYGRAARDHDAMAAIVANNKPKPLGKAKRSAHKYWRLSWRQ